MRRRNPLKGSGVPSGCNVALGIDVPRNIAVPAVVRRGLATVGQGKRERKVLAGEEATEAKILR